MAKTYKAPKTINAIVRFFNRLGVGRSQTLTTTGRVSGKARQVPVTPIDVDGDTYLVAPYGSVSWVRNARLDPKVTLSSGGRQVDVSVGRSIQRGCFRRRCVLRA